MPHCPHCGEDPHDDECRPQTATRLADHLIDHPEDLELAALRLQVADLTDQLRHLAAEVHQR